MLGKNLFLYQLGVGTPGTMIGDVHADTLALSAVCMLGILAVGSTVANSMVVEGPGTKWQAVVENFWLFTDDLAKGQIGPHYKVFYPLIAAIFIFVLIANFIGVMPWKLFEHQSWWPMLYSAGQPTAEHFDVASPTTDFNVTAGLALVALLFYLGSGFWKHGAHYAKVLFFSPLAFIELMDMIVRPSTLALRLMVVITADELLRGAFLTMCPVLVPAGIMGFELFIGIIQAFVFALLTSIYIGLTVADHH